MITKAEEEIELLKNELKGLQNRDKLKADVAYTHLTSIVKWLIATIVVIFIGIIGTVLWLLNNFDFTIEEIAIDAGYGNANYIEGEANTINNGENI